MSTRKSFIENSFFNSFFNLFNQALAVFILPLFINNIGEEQYGIWIMSSLLIGYFGFLDLGLTEGIVKFVSENFKSKRDNILISGMNTFFILFFSIGIVIIVAVLFFGKKLLEYFEISELNFEDAFSLILVTSFFAPFFWLFKASSSFFKGTLNHKLISGYNLISNLSGTISLIVMINKGFSLLELAVYSNLIRVIILSLQFLHFKKIIPTFRFSLLDFSIKVISSNIRFSLNVLIIQVLSFLAVQIDTFIIASYITVSKVAVYAISTKLFFVSLNNLAYLSEVIQPISYKAFTENNHKLINKIITTGTRYNTILYSIVGYIGIVISPLFIQTWVGTDYLDIIIWSQILMGYLLISGGFGLPMNMYFNSGRTNIPIITISVSVIINVYFSFLLIDDYGIGGPILGTVLGGGVTLLTFPFYCNKLKVNVIDSLKNISYILVINLPIFSGFIYISKYLPINWVNLIVFSLSMISIFFINTYYLILNKEEKSDLTHLLKSSSVFSK